MKNTKHTENLDNSTPQEITSQSKRKILTSIGVSSGIIGASALSQQWTKPIVNSIILPAHAQSTPMMTTMAMGDMTTTPSMSDGMDDGTTTTMMPTTTMAPAPASRIMVSTDNMGTIGDGGTADLGVATYQIRLSDMPSNTVTVTVTASPDTSVSVAGGSGAGGNEFEFTLNDYDTWQPVTVTSASGDVTKDTEVTVTFKASGGGYDEMREEMITVVNDDVALPTMVMVKITEVNSGGDMDGAVEVSWTKPATSKEILYYLVHQSTDGEISSTPALDAMKDIRNTDTKSEKVTQEVSGLARGTYHFAVTAVFGAGAANLQTESAGGTASAIN